MLYPVSPVWGRCICGCVAQAQIQTHMCLLSGVTLVQSDHILQPLGVSKDEHPLLLVTDRLGKESSSREGVDVSRCKHDSPPVVIAVCASTLVDTRKSNRPRLAGDNKTPEATTTLHCEIVPTILTSQLTTCAKKTETKRKCGGAIHRPLRPSTARLMPFPAEMRRRPVRKAVVPAL
ncbi:hypothetical protein H9L39_10813 [Fusarium oxysporum f. sp. albedinis]|nr:hypothetical protein H9L39_10813 [Fusarium oxysporum f. sp. albedinis]